MRLTVDLSKDAESALTSQARAAHMSAERYLSQIIESALKRQHLLAAENLA